MTKYWMVGLGGFLGSIARFWLGSYITYRMGARFPFGTFVINISGSFLIGLIVTLLGERAHWSPNLLYLIPIGFIGAYTTFSTFELEAFRNVRTGEVLMALLYVVLSVTVGFIAVWLGVLTGKTLA
ncbi:MAG TPA: fluoride efflux transporter CrcB [Candidatus Acidoferrales bacterium]|jgi:CrcB protein|nr:fluoride efflux transporter CrcB [Candidatus Acidoferrales bacterium]